MSWSSPGAMLNPPPQSLADLVQRFHTEHAARFAHSDEADVVEIATLRLAAIGRMPDHELAEAASAVGDPAPPHSIRQPPCMAG